MKHPRLFFALLCVALMVSSTAAVGAALSRTYLPLLPAQSGAPVLLVDHDCGFVTAAQVDGRFYVGYQTRPDGRLHIAEDTGDALVELPAPMMQTLLPAFSPPGPKQGGAALVADGTRLRLYYTSRAVGDDTGPFKLWRLSIMP